jgi:hypothetical protein
VIFVFSKRRCEENAAVLTNIDLCTASEKSEVHIVVEKSIARLKVEDRGLPQIRRIRDLLGRGVAVHHGGLLPIVKEVTLLPHIQLFTNRWWSYCLREDWLRFCLQRRRLLWYVDYFGRSDERGSICLQGQSFSQE